MRNVFIGLWLVVFLPGAVCLGEEESRILRHPHYHEGNIVFSYLGDLWLIREDGTGLRRLTIHVERDLYSRFSPDGKHIAFSSKRSGNYDVFVMPSEGGTPQQLTTFSGPDFAVGWMPDGSALVYAGLYTGLHSFGRGSHLFTVSLKAEIPKPLGTGMGYFGTFSPDGKRFAFNRRNFHTWRKDYRGSWNADVWVMDLEKKSFRQLTDFEGHDAWPLWAATGEIFFASDRDGTVNLWKLPAEVVEAGQGEALQVTFHKGKGVTWPAISNDGKVIVYERDFRLYKLRVDAAEPEPLPLHLPSDVKENPVMFPSYGGADQFDVSPDGKRIVFSAHGEIFTVPVEEGMPCG